jgi:polyhydroxyalkanoate synthesis regulator phasin
MKHTQLIDELLNELSYRCDEGIVDLKNKNHIRLLEVILYEKRLYEVADILIRNLLNEQDGYKHIGAGIYVADRDVDSKGKAKDGAKKYRKDGEGESASYSPISDDEAEDIKKKQGEEGEKAAAAYNKSQEKGDDGELVGDEQPEEEESKGAKVQGSDMFSHAPDVKKDKEGEESGDLEPRGDTESKQKHIQNGFVKGAAPGNPGSMYNEIMSGEVAKILETEPNLSEEQLVDRIINLHGSSKLAQQNSGNKPAAGFKVSDLPKDLPTNERELYTKTLVAVRSGKRKHQRTQSAKEILGWNNTQTEEYFGDSEGLKKQEEDVLSANRIVDLDGNEIAKNEIIQLIREGGKGDNPSDTATIIFNKDNGEATVLFSSDKDSLDAIVAQSTLKAEVENNKKLVDDLVEKGDLTEQQGNNIKNILRSSVENHEKTESELKMVGNEPAKWFIQYGNISEVLDNIKNDTKPDGTKDKEKTSTRLQKTIRARGKIHPNIRPYLTEQKDTYSDEELLEAFFKFMGDDEKETEPTNDQVTLMERINTRYIDKGAPDIFSKLEDIRNRTLQNQRDVISELDKQKINIDGREVGVGTLLEANTIWKQFHLEALDESSQKGVHKYRGMFEVNHGGLIVNGKVLRECLGVSNQSQFVSEFEVGEIEEQVGVSGTQKGRTTGGKRIVYALVRDEKGETKKVEIGQKVMRTKSGKTGKLQTVYNWTDDMKDCFDSKN